MKNHFFGGIVRSIETTENGTTWIFRILHSLCNGEEVYSIFATTERGENRDECFIFDIARDEAGAVRLCELLAEYGVSAVNAVDVLSDMVGGVFDGHDMI